MAETVALTLLGVGTVASAYSQSQQGKEAREINKRNAALANQEAALISETARRNAAIAEAEAERARYAKREEAREFRKEARRILAMQRTRYAKSGVLAGVGTPLIVGDESKKQFARQAAVINEQGIYDWELGMSEAAMLRKTGRFQVGYARSQAKMFRKTGKSAYRAGRWGAGTTLATGFGSLYLLSGSFNPQTKLQSAGTAAQKWLMYKGG